MKEEILTDALLREFLLGKLDDEEQQRIEDLFITDSRARERVLAAEQDLIEEYLEDSLTTADRERFLSRFAQTPTQRRKLRITKSIKDWAVTEAAATQADVAVSQTDAAISQTVPSKISIRSRAGAWLLQKIAFVVPIAVATVIAIIVATVWLNSRIERNRRHLAIKQELAQLNTPESRREAPSQILLELSPVTVRSVEQQAEIKRSADIQIVELQLPWIKKRYSVYQAEVHRVGDDESYTIPNLHPENDGGYFIRIRLSAQMLSRGQYQIHLSGIAADGFQSNYEEYTFTVSD